MRIISKSDDLPPFLKPTLIIETDDGPVICNPIDDDSWEKNDNGSLKLANTGNWLVDPKIKINIYHPDSDSPVIEEPFLIMSTQELIDMFGVDFSEIITINPEEMH